MAEPHRFFSGGNESMADNANAGGVPSTGQAGSGAGIAATPQPTTANTTTQAQPAQETQAQGAGQGAGGEKPQAQSEATSKASLTDDPKFKQWQASRDRALEQQRQQYAQVQQAYAQTQQELENLRLASADDGQKAAYYQSKLAEFQQAQQAEANRQAWTNWYTNQAFAVVQSSGIDMNDERLLPVLADGAYASPQGMMQLSARLVEILKQDVAKARGEAELERKRGRTEALVEAGVTQTSAGVGGSAPGTADEAKVQAWRTKVATLRASGRVTPDAFADLLAEGKKLGIAS